MDRKPVRPARRWASKDQFKAELSGRGVQSGEIVKVRGKRARAGLAPIIMHLMSDGQPRTGAEIRAATLPLAKLKTSDAYHVCLNSWALVDLLAAKRLTAALKTTYGPRGGERVEKVYSLAA